MQPAALGVIEGHTVRCSTDHLPQRHVGAFTLDVPQGGVDRCDSERRDRASCGRPSAVIDGLPNLFDAVAVHADQLLQQVVTQESEDCGAAGANRVAIPHTVNTVRGSDVDEDRFLLQEGLDSIGARRFDRNVDQICASRCDCRHGVLAL